MTSVFVLRNSFATCQVLQCTDLSPLAVRLNVTFLVSVEVASLPTKSLIIDLMLGFVALRLRYAVHRIDFSPASITLSRRSPIKRACYFALEKVLIVDIPATNSVQKMTSE